MAVETAVADDDFENNPQSVVRVAESIAQAEAELLAARKVMTGAQTLIGRGAGLRYPVSKILGELQVAPLNRFPTALGVGIVPPYEALRNNLNN
jgi:hypothetical protein